MCKSIAEMRSQTAEKWCSCHARCAGHFSEGLSQVPQPLLANELCTVLHSTIRRVKYASSFSEFGAVLAAMGGLCRQTAHGTSWQSPLAHEDTAPRATTMMGVQSICR